MTHAYDPELAAAAARLGSPVMADIPAARRAAARGVRAADLTGVTVTDEDASGVRLRLYQPDVVRAPAAVFTVHGGGFVLGTVERGDARNAELARALGMLVVSVDYRLAPEHPYPAALDDCLTGLSWLAGTATRLGIDPRRIAISGTGGGLCAALALLARDRGGPAIAFQYLGVPKVDDRLGSASMTAFTDTAALNRADVEAGWRAYLGGSYGGDVPCYAAPARATDLSGLPPAYVSAMQFDPLRDEGIAYALALQAAGVPVELHLFPGTFHGSSTVRDALVSRREIDEKVAVLRKALESIF